MTAKKPRRQGIEYTKPVREGTFLIRGEGGWAGASEGRVISKYFTNWRGSNLFYTQPGEGRGIFWQGKNYSMSVS